MADLWMTVPEVAALLGVSTMWVHRRIAAGLIEVSNEALAGRRPRYRISEAALQRYFESQRVAVAPRARRDEPRRRGRVRDG